MTDIKPRSNLDKGWYLGNHISLCSKSHSRTLKDNTHFVRCSYSFLELVRMIKYRASIGECMVAFQSEYLLNSANYVIHSPNLYLDATYMYLCSGCHINM